MVSAVNNVLLVLSLTLILYIKKYSSEQMRTHETFPIGPEERRAIGKLSIADLSDVTVKLNYNARKKYPEMDSQYWADRTLAQLSELYPWLRFLIIVGNKMYDFTRRIPIWYMNHQISMYTANANDTRAMMIYFTFAINRYEGDKLDCYGNITNMFQSCDPSIRNIREYIQGKCKESFGYIEVNQDDYHNYGMAWNLPENAFKIEEFRCQQGPLAGNKTWRVIYAQFQPMDHVVSLVDNLIKGNPENYSMPFLGLYSANHDHECHNTDVEPFLYAIILLLLSMILLVLCLLYKMCKQCKGSFGFYFRFSWLFGTNEEENELDNTLINTEQLIYTGPNSRVYFARYRFTEFDFRNIVVKVPSRDAFQMSAIIEETRIAAQLRHPRVVEYIGFYRDAFGDVRIVSEFMAGGDLHAHLSRRENEINVGLIFNFISQIAEGMEYLISQHIIHRDLATRNCMLNLVGNAIKIADFGLSRQFNLDANYASSSPVCLPLRWLPIECFDKDGRPLRNCSFNEKTDIWAFGVVIWECFTRGAQPYGAEDCKEFIHKLMECKKEHFNEENAHDGWPLKRPVQCPQILYDQVMLKCWATEQMNRATFCSAREALDEVFDEIMINCPDVLRQSVV